MDEETLLNENEVATMSGLSVSRLWRMRATRIGIPFIKLSPERTGRIRYRLEDVMAYIAKNPKPTKEPKPKATAAVEVRMIAPVTLTCEQGSQRHPGETPRNLAKRCLKGVALAKRFGGPSRVPEAKKKDVLFARKIGKGWHIPVSELDRVFLGKQD